MPNYARASTARSALGVANPLWTLTAYVGLTGFQEQYFTSNVEERHGRAFGDFLARRARYAVYWSHYENNVYRRIHAFADLLKSDYQLYQYIRSIYSPAYRIGEFWSGKLWGGALDPDAGDGKVRPSALPIEADNEALHPVIAQIWRDSNWQANKQVATRFGPVLGDVGIMVVDDPTREKVYLKVIHPGTIAYLDRDPQGNVRAYKLEYLRADPTWVTPVGPRKESVYTEVCERVGDAIHYRTFRDGEPFDWDYDPTGQQEESQGPEWTEPLPFCPLVFIQHRDMGQGWGWSEYHPSLSKLHELDDLASKLSDQIRQTVHALWLLAGVTPPEGGQLDLAPAAASTTENNDPGRSAVPAIYSPDPQARAQALVANLPIAEASAHVQTILRGLEQDHPELEADLATSSGDASGRALRVAREKVEQMVWERRAGYDDALVRAQMMAISIGAIKGYPGFGDFDEGSFDRGDLFHHVGDRPVFAVDEMDRIEERQARANVLKVLRDSGLGLRSAMVQSGYSPEDVDEAVSEADAEQQKALDRARKAQQLMFADQPTDATASANLAGDGGTQSGGDTAAAGGGQ